MTNETIKVKEEFDDINKKLKTEIESNIALKENINVKDLKIEDLLNKLILKEQFLKKEKEKNIVLEKRNKSEIIKLQKECEIKCNELNFQKNIAEDKLNKITIEYNNIRKILKKKKLKKVASIKADLIINNEVLHENKFKFLIQKINFLVRILFIPLMMISLYDKFFKNNDSSKVLDEDENAKKNNKNELYSLKTIKEEFN